MKDEDTISDTLEEDLIFWMYDVDVEIVYEVLEFLYDRNLLSERGIELYHDFWAKYITNNNMLSDDKREE